MIILKFSDYATPAEFKKAETAAKRTGKKVRVI